MQYIWDRTDNTNGKLSIFVEGEEWKTQQAAAREEIEKDSRDKNHKKDETADNEAKEPVSEEQVLDKALAITLNKALGVILEAKHIELIDAPSMLEKNVLTSEKMEVVLALKVSPEVTLGEYKGLHADKAEVVITEEDIQNELKIMQKRAVKLETADKKAELGDTVIIDFVGYIDDLPFENGAADNFSLKLGSNMFIDGFEEALVGAKAGENRRIAATFPKNYQIDTLAGQETMFKVKINEVRREVFPEIDDQLIEGAGIADVHTVDDYRDYITRILIAERTEQADWDYKDALLAQAAQNAMIEVPDEILEGEIEQSFNDFQEELTNRGVRLSDYLQRTKTTEDAIKDGFRESATIRIRKHLVMNKLLEVENLEPDKADIETQYELIGKEVGADAEAAKHMYPYESVKNMARSRKILDFLAENAK